VIYANTTLMGHKYTGVVNPKPRNGQRNVHYCMRGTKTENEKNIK